MLGIALVVIFYLVEWLDKKSLALSAAEGPALKQARTLRPAPTASITSRVAGKPAAPRALPVAGIEPGGLPARLPAPQPQAARSDRPWTKTLGDRPQEEAPPMPAASR